MARMKVRCLSIHADYRCRHSGACCTSGWAIPVERGLLPRLTSAIDAGRLVVPSAPSGTPSPFLVPDHAPAEVAAVLRTDAAGTCSFYRRGDGLCAIQHALGHGSLPASCQHFPRVCLLEPDVVWVTLSHYCPTAVDLLFRTDVELSVVEAPSTLNGNEIEVEGLDARETFPPLVRPGLLADREIYHAWERFFIEALGEDATPERALARVSQVTERLRRWQPGPTALPEALDSAIADVGDPIADQPAASPPARPPSQAVINSYRLVCSAIPDKTMGDGPSFDLEKALTENVDPSWPAFSRAIANYVASKAFANWSAYQGHGLRTVVRSVEVALDVLRLEAARQCASAGRPLDADLLRNAFRAADLLLLHLVSPEQLADRLRIIENERT
ncbi:MAG TPA: hypothetical protein VGK32_04660 [Vicinamibacterales bacterium]|jgi:hypothetical protein